MFLLSIAGAITVASIAVALFGVTTAALILFKKSSHAAPQQDDKIRTCIYTRRRLSISR